MDEAQEDMDKGMIIFEDIGELTAFAARLFACLCAIEIERKGFFTAVLSGGSTPKRFFKKLASPEFQDRVCWEKVHLFWGDERNVPPDDKDSNFGLAARELLARVPVPLENIHRMQVDLGPVKAAKEYEAEIKAFFVSRGTSAPRFDLVFLGLGTDGHTLSLFPGSKAVSEEKRLIVENYVKTLSSWRVTMTPAIVNNAKTCVFMASGEEKMDAVKEAVEGNLKALPAGLIRPSDGRLLWLVDKGAASALKQSMG